MVADGGYSAACGTDAGLADTTTEGHALIFDLAGTLLDLAAQPAAAHVARGLTGSLARLLWRCDGPVAIISGRTVPDVDALLAPLKLAGAGIHGLQMRASAASAIISAETSLPLRVRREVRRFAAMHREFDLEDKGQAVAIHFRACPDLAAAVCAFAERMSERYRERIAVQHGKMVTEIRAPGANKGAALRALMSLPAFLNRKPLYFGDDLTDEAAFGAAQQLGGQGVLIGSPGHPTVASAALATPEQLRRLIDALAPGEDRSPGGEQVWRCR